MLYFYSNLQSLRNIMQKIISLIFSIFALCLSNAVAQCSPVCGSGTICLCSPVMYTYDGAGNRTDRYQVCTCQQPSGRLASPAQTNDNTNQAASTMLSIQPNPTTGKVTIVFASALEKGTIVVTDATGKQVATYAVSGSNYEIDMAMLPGGLYVFTLQTADRLESRKVVKTD